MKKSLLLLLPLLALIFTSCDDNYYPYDDGYDQYLPGQWELIQADGRAVSGYQVNYLTFYQNGGGEYYYYDHGTPYNMALVWNADSYNQILYVTYADGAKVSMDYWFNSNATRLYTQWYSGGYRHQYVYQLVKDFSWPYNGPALLSEEEPFQTQLPGAPYSKK